MDTSNEDQNLAKLADGIKNIYIDNNELLSISLEFSDIFFKRKDVDEESFDKFWASPVLLEMVSAATQEAVSLALATITLNEDVDFTRLINLVIDKEKETNGIKELSSDVMDKIALRNFIYTLRREVYSRVYSQSKSFLSVSEISNELAEERKDLFMEINDGEV